ncbi:ParA family protein [Yinghuangia aomiensis]
MSIDPQASTVWWAGPHHRPCPSTSAKSTRPRRTSRCSRTFLPRFTSCATRRGGVGKTTTTLNIGAVVSNVLNGQDRGLQHVFIDTPGSLQDENLLLKALAVADDVIVPMPPEPLAFDPTARTIEKVVQPTGLPYRVVINNWDPRDGVVDLEQTKEYIAAKGWPRTQTVLRRYKVHTRAAAEGQVVTQYPKNRVAMEAREDFFRLALELGYGGQS